MMQLNYDEIRLLRELKNSERKAAGNKLDVGLERLVKEGYATTFHPNLSETLYSITTKGWAALHEAEGNDQSAGGVRNRPPAPSGEWKDDDFDGFPIAWMSAASSRYTQRPIVGRRLRRGKVRRGGRLGVPISSGWRDERRLSRSEEPSAGGRINEPLPGDSSDITDIHAGHLLLEVAAPVFASGWAKQHPTLEASASRPFGECSDDDQGLTASIQVCSKDVPIAPW